MDDLTRRPTTRRHLLTGAAALAVAACTSNAQRADARDRGYGESSGGQARGDEYREDEIVGAVSNFFGVTAQAAAEVVERIFGDLGRPNAYIAGEEAAGAVAVGLRYGEGWLYRRSAQPQRIYWTGPSVGFDIGLNASKCFTLVYNLERPEQLYQRIPGVEGSYYFIAGVGVNYQRAGEVVLAPMRTGVGARAGVNIGYLNYTPEREWVPL